jgi:hypothetical protein
MSDTTTIQTRLAPETLEVIEAVLFQTFPPINPAVLLKAMREWYVTYGDGPVLGAFLDWLTQIIESYHGKDSLDVYRNAREDYLAKTGKQLTEVKQG